MRLALLAGTSEAREVARHLAAEGRDAVASLAGATRAPAPLAVPTRIGGFGGDAPFAEWLRAEGIGAILDATHPFAARISHRAASAARALGLPHRQLLRPPWAPGPGDLWTTLSREEDAAAHVPPGGTVFLATGRQTLERFGGLDARLICRRIDPPRRPFPLPNGEWRLGRPPFSVEDEVALFRRLGVDWLIVKNAGGEASRSKLDAARILAIPVGMIARPPQPDCARVETVEEAMAWIRSLD